MIVPPLVTQGTELVDDAARLRAPGHGFVAENETLRNLRGELRHHGQARGAGARAPGAARQRGRDAAATSASAIVNSIFALVTILILSVFLVGSGPAGSTRRSRCATARAAERLRGTLDRIGAGGRRYVAGALAQATVAGIPTCIVLLILGVPFAGAARGHRRAFDLIPLVGATIGAVVVGLVTLFTDFPTATIVWVIWAIVYQQIENTVIQPQIQKRAVDVHPFVVLVAVLFGSTLFGVFGALLAIPAAASRQIVIREYLRLRRYEEPAGCRRSGAPPRPAPAYHTRAMQPGITTARLDASLSERFQRLRAELGIESLRPQPDGPAPGQRRRIHRHERQEEVYLVLEGTLTSRPTAASARPRPRDRAGRPRSPPPALQPRGRAALFVCVVVLSKV